MFMLKKLFLSVAVLVLILFKSVYVFASQGEDIMRGIL